MRSTFTDVPSSSASMTRALSVAGSPSSKTAATCAPHSAKPARRHKAVSPIVALAAKHRAVFLLKRIFFAQKTHHSRAGVLHEIQQASAGLHGTLLQAAGLCRAQKVSSCGIHPFCSRAGKTPASLWGSRRRYAFFSAATTTAAYCFVCVTLTANSRPRSSARSRALPQSERYGRPEGSRRS